MAVTAGDLLPTIKKLVASYLEEIGSTDEAQAVYLFPYLNHALRKLANIAYVMKISDPLSISSDGFVTFNLNTQPITNLYAPLRILEPSGTKEVRKRTSFVDTNGWWRESANTQIHVKGLASGLYTLHYIAYPATVATNNSPIEFPDSGTMGLCYYVAALIVESLPNAKDLATHYYSLAERDMKIAVQGNVDARGHSSGGYVPSLNLVDTVFKG